MLSYLRQSPKTMSKLSHLPLSILAIITLCCVLACAGPTGSDEDASMDMGGPLDIDEMPPGTPVRALRCEADEGAIGRLASRPKEAWLRSTSSLIAKVGAPSHALHDVLTTRSRDVDFLGLVMYGGLGVELSGEIAELYIHNCEQDFELLSRVLIGRDGRARFVLEEQDVPFHGVYSIALRLPGDGSLAHATLRVLPAGTKIVVMDLDGVLSEDRISAFGDALRDLFAPIGAGERVPEPRPDASGMTRLRSSQGYEILYLTARPPELTDESRAWLSSNQFAEGTLWFDDRDQASRSSRQYGAYKSGVLARMRARGYELSIAYASNPEELEGFQSAAITPIYLVDFVSNAGGVPMGSTFSAHNAAIEQETPISQPFYFE